MMRLPIISFILLAGSVSTSACDFDLSDVSLGIGVVGDFPDIAVDGFVDVTIPFSNSHDVSLGLSSVSASYEFDNSRFLVQAMIASEAGNSGTRLSVSDSMFQMTPATDILVQYEGQFDFNLPADSMTANFGIGVTDAASPADQIAVDILSHNTVLGLGPRTFAIQGEFIMPANRTWVTNASMSIRANASSRGHVATGTGYIEFRFIPEPSTLCLFVASSIVILRRRR